MSRRSDIDWVRAVSICGVVLLHSSSLFVSRQSRLTVLGVTPAMLCNQATRFCVPVFFMLSGLGLSISKRTLRLPGFWLHRLRRTAVPYILWTVFYYLSDKGFRIEALFSASGLYTLGRMLLTGGAASHLWFLPVLLQLYFLYPGLKCLIRRFPVLTLLGTFLLSMFCTLVYYVPLFSGGWWRPCLWRMFPPWLFYFVLGLALSEKRLECAETFIHRRMPVFVLAAVAAALLYTWDAVQRGDLDSIKPQLFLYSPFCFVLLASSWTRLQRLPGLASLSAFIARHSMTVYFSHIFFLRILRQVRFLNTNALTMLLMFTAVLFLSVLTGIIPEMTERLLKRMRSAMN